MQRMHRLVRVLPILGAALFIATGASAASEGIHPSVTAMNQKLKNDAVSITYAYLPGNGTLAILSGDPAQKASSAKVIGSVDLSAGDHRDFKVQLNSQPKAGSRLWAEVEQAKSGKLFAGGDERAEQSFKAL